MSTRLVRNRSAMTSSARLSNLPPALQRAEDQRLDVPGVPSPMRTQLREADERHHPRHGHERSQPAQQHVRLEHQVGAHDRLTGLDHVLPDVAEQPRLAGLGVGADRACSRRWRRRLLPAWMIVSMQ